MQTQEYVAYIDDAPVEFSQPEVSGRELMTKAGSDQLVVLEEDGSQRPVSSDEVFELARGKHFKRPPHFKRG